MKTIKLKRTKKGIIGQLTDSLRSYDDYQKIKGLRGQYIFQEDPNGFPVYDRSEIQNGALFSGLTVKQNIQMPMREMRHISQKLMDELAMLKIELVGLSLDAADKFPSELSGGMVKRAALARALALDPELLFLDEPTSGLDPIGAAEFDELISTLQHSLGLTVFMVTHDLDSLYSICDRVAALADGKVIAQGPLKNLLASPHPWLKAYFHGVRGERLTSTFGDYRNN